MDQFGARLINKYRTERKCSGCGKSCYKQSHDMKVWSGLCMKCAAIKRMSVRTGENHHNWIPFRKCADCSCNLPKKSKSPTRCNSCFRKHNIKENHPRWEGGKSAENHLARGTKEYKNWAKAVKERDNYTCQICGKRDGTEMHSDHIKPFSLNPELRLEISNGRTLCKKCHELHGWRLFTHQNPRKNWINKPGKNSQEVQVICMDTKKVFVSVAEAGRRMNLMPQKISLVINEKRKRTGGYSFQRLTGEHLIF